MPAVKSSSGETREQWRLQKGTVRKGPAIMPRTKYWKKSVARRKGFHSDHLKTWRKSTLKIKRKNTKICIIPQTNVKQRRSTPRFCKNMNMYLFADLEKTERRLQYISSQNERHLYDVQNENSTNKIAELKQEKQQMKEEIALLKLKIDLLLNMLAQATAVTNYQHDELKRLRAQIGKT